MDAQWDDLKTILVVARHRTLAAASRELGLNYTTVARRIDRAEAALGVKLFERLAGGYNPTEEAELISRHAATMEAANHRLMRELGGRDARLSGPFVVTAPQLLIAHVLGPVLDMFSEAHPDVDLHLKASNDLLDLDRREADLAIRISHNPGDHLTGLRLTEQQSASFATPDWAARIVAAPEGPVDWLVYDQLGEIPKNVRVTTPPSRIRMRFDDMVAMAGAAQAGLGVARMPMFLGRALPELVQVPCLPPQPYLDIWAVAHPDVWPSAKSEAFRRVLRAHFKEVRSVFVA
ncbi:MAG: LysR family transcriptional regulator [Pseudomonadota bacterium]